MEEKQSGGVSRGLHAATSHLLLGSEAEEDAGEERLRPDGAVEGGDAGQEGPEHHQDVDVAAERSSSGPGQSAEHVT